LNKNRTYIQTKTRDSLKVKNLNATDLALSGLLKTSALKTKNEKERYGFINHTVPF